MATRTNLEIVNAVLDSMGSDNINSIDDTQESMRIIQFLEDVFYETIHQGTWPHLRKVMNLEAATSAYPNYLTLPERTIEVGWIKYDRRLADTVAPVYDDVEYCEPFTFMSRILGRDPNSADVTVITDYDGSDLFIHNERPPNFWTSFDDVNIVFDSWDSTLDSELRSDKSRAELYIEPVFQRANDYVPELPPRAFPGLIAELKSVASFQLRQVVNEKAEQQSRRQRHQRLRGKYGRTEDATFRPDYGRHGPRIGKRNRLVVGRYPNW